MDRTRPTAAPATRRPAPATRDTAPSTRRPAPETGGPAPAARRPAPAARGAAPAAGGQGPATRYPAPSTRGPASAGRRPVVARWARRPVAGAAARDRRVWSGPVAIMLVLVGLFATGAGLGQATGVIDWPSWGSDDPPPRAFPVLEPSAPVRILIPSIDVRAEVHAVGLARDGSIAVPALERHNEAAWYKRGPTPGQFGPAIIVGHADTRSGPSVFHDLGKLGRGATVEVTREDRRVAVFRVDSVERFDKGRLPGNRVYGDFSRPGLRLITCGGRWVGSSIGYADNIIVFASLVETHRA
jgi:hypothetical protein